VGDDTSIAVTFKTLPLTMSGCIPLSGGETEVVGEEKKGGYSRPRGIHHRRAERGRSALKNYLARPTTRSTHGVEEVGRRREPEKKRGNMVVVRGGAPRNILKWSEESN